MPSEDNTPRMEQILDLIDTCRKNGVFQLHAGGIWTEAMLAAAMPTKNPFRTIHDGLVKPRGRAGVPCLRIDGHAIGRINALEAYIAEHERDWREQCPE